MSPPTLEPIVEAPLTWLNQSNAEEFIEMMALVDGWGMLVNNGCLVVKNGA